MIDLSSISTSPDPPLISLVFQYEPNIGRSPIDPCFRISCVDRDSSKQLETSLRKKKKMLPCLLLTNPVSLLPRGRRRLCTTSRPSFVSHPNSSNTTSNAIHHPTIASSTTTTLSISFPIPLPSLSSTGRPAAPDISAIPSLTAPHHDEAHFQGMLPLPSCTPRCSAISKFDAYPHSYN